LNYYPHHIGDFNNATRHLTRVERSVYRDLIELYYDTERPLIADMTKLCRLIIARSDEEVTAAEQVLNEFFTQTADGWFHDRCDEEIGKYHNNKQAKSAAGKASAAKRAQKPTTESNDNATGAQQPLDSAGGSVQPTSNQEPITINQEPQREEKPSPPAAQSSRAPRATRLPTDWQLPNEWEAWALTEQPSWTPEGARRVADSFRDHWIGKGGADARKVDWEATWRNWVRREKTPGGFPLKTNNANTGRKTPALENFKEKAYVGTDEAAIDWMR
jgi:uncharacterized protein YdaU (DUF1376 family)